MQKLISEYDQWLTENAQKVPEGWCLSADELVLHTEWFNPEQIAWLKNFQARWDEAA